MTNPTTNPETPVEKRLYLNGLIRSYKANLHVLSAKREIAREIVDLVDANPWLNDQISYDLSGSVRTAARS